MQVIIFSNEKALHDLSKKLRPGDACYYLSDDYITLLKIKKTLDEGRSIHLFEESFHEAVDTIREEFLQFSHKINRLNDSETFWGTHLASRNSASIPLLKYSAYYYCAKKILDEAGCRIIFICESYALAKILKEAAEEINGLDCDIRFTQREMIRNRLIYYKLLLRSIFFFLSSIAQVLYSRTLKNQRLNPGPKRSRVILRSWFTSGCITKDGKYIDRNFGELSDFLEKQGIEVWTIPVFFNLNKNTFSQMREISRLPNKFIIQEQYLTVIDIIRTLIDGVLAIFLKQGEMHLFGRDFEPVVREIHLKISVSPGLLPRNSVNYLLKRLSRQSIEVSKFIYPVENNVMEKPFILSIRNYYPEAEIVGFQHTVWLQEQFGMCLIPEELEYHPLPDMIVCSGRRYMGILEKAGFPKEILSLGPNLRYTMVNNKFDVPQNRVQNNTLEVLIILSGLEQDNYEILEKSGAALKRMEDIRVYIKPHPLNPFEKLKYFLSEIRFPVYEIAQGSVQEWVIRVNTVIMGSGSVSNLETMAIGVPLIRVSLGGNFDLDPLWDEYPFAPFIRTTEEICHNLERARNLTSAQFEQLACFGCWLVENYFEPVTPEKMMIFVDNNVSNRSEASFLENTVHTPGE